MVRDTPVAGSVELTALLLGTLSLAIHVPPLMPKAALLTYWNLFTWPMLLLQGVLLARLWMGVRAEPDTARRRVDVARLATARGLSERELQVLTMMLDGLATKEIASRLDVSIHTVKSHVYNLFRKMNVRDLTPQT